MIHASMYATFNGIHLQRVFFRKSHDNLETIRFADRNPEIESEIRLGYQVTLLLGNGPVTGKIIHYIRGDEEYEVTIETVS